MEYPDQPPQYIAYPHPISQSNSPYHEHPPPYPVQQSQTLMSMPPKMHDPKPRLGKEEVDILEAEFQRNPKPSTQVKRQFAEDMAVELPRINNWFQNRRAKRKQEKKQEAALEANQARDSRGYSEPSSPDFFNPQSIFDGHELSPQQSVGSFSTMSGPTASVSSFGPQYTDFGNVSMDSLQNSSNRDNFQNAFEEHHDGLLPVYGSTANGLSNGDIAQIPHYNGVSEFAYDGVFVNTSFDESAQSLQGGIHEPTAIYNDFPATSVEGIHPVMVTTAFPSQLLSGQFQDLPENQGSEHSEETPITVGFSYSTSGSEDSLSPPGPSHPFKSPQPTDIASRRKKVHNKPAALGTDTMRSRPPMGPRTVSHADGIRRHSDSPHGSPMRRINSAGGNSRNVISGRVNKSSVESSQRSPINFGGFMECNQYRIRYPLSMSAPSAPNSSLAPPTPMSPHGGEMALAKNANTTSSTSPSDSGLNFIYNTSCYAPAEDQNLASPPETPQAQIMHAAANGWTTAHDDQQWDFEVSDEPIYTPAHETFLELRMPQPMYLSTMSQPVTPAFGQFSPSVPSAHESPQYMQMPGQSEYPFVEQQHYHIKVEHNSSISSRQKTFQFSNCTPADFSDK